MFISLNSAVRGVILIGTPGPEFTAYAHL